VCVCLYFVWDAGEDWWAGKMGRRSSRGGYWEEIGVLMFSCEEPGRMVVRTGRRGCLEVLDIWSGVVAGISDGKVFSWKYLARGG